MQWFVDVIYCINKPEYTLMKITLTKYKSPRIKNEPILFGMDSIEIVNQERWWFGLDKYQADQCELNTSKTLQAFKSIPKNKAKIKIFLFHIKE